MRVFDMNGSFYKFGTLIFDLILLNMFVILILGVGLGFTFGMAFIAMFYTLYESIRQDKGRLLYHFLKSIKENLKQGLLLSLIIILLTLFMAMVMSNLWVFGEFSIFVVVTQYLLIFELGMISLFLFPLLAKVQMPLFQAIRYAFLLAHKHFLTSISCLSLVILNYYIIKFISPIIIVFSFSGTGYIVERLVFENIIVEQHLSSELKEALKVDDTLSESSF